MTAEPRRPLLPGTKSYPPKFYQPFLLKALGTLTDFQYGVFVESSKAILETLKQAGFDPDNLPAGVSRTGRTPAGTDRNISLCHRLLYRDWAIPRTMRGPKPGMWGLTAEGILLAEELCKKDKPENLTMQWLDQHLRPKRGEKESELMRILRAAIKNKLPISARTGRVDDHIHECFHRLIRRDALRKQLEAGKEITYTHIATYAVNSGRTDVRNDGTEPVCREIYGARTEYERKHGHAVDMRSSADAAQVAYRADEDGRMAVIDIVEADTTDRVDTALFFEKFWPRIEAVMVRHKPNAAARYLNILKLWMQNQDLDEVARAEGVSKHRAAAMVADARKVLVGVQKYITADFDIVPDDEDDASDSQPSAYEAAYL